jgi:hypothetical protein
MKVMIEYDDEGNIQSVVVPISIKAGPQIMPRPQPGNLLAAIEVPEVRDEKDVKTLGAIRRLYTVKGSGSRAVLERKT